MFANGKAQTDVPTPGAEMQPGACAASLRYWPRLPATPDGRSSGIAFGFEAPSARTIDGATMVADTDGGWYTWTANAIAIDYSARGQFFSKPAVATFNEPVIVRHAWVTEANGGACALPAFNAPSTMLDKALATRGWPEVLAKAESPPYNTDCARPFESATVVKVVQPEYPRNAYPGVYYAQILIVVGDRDNLVDASVYKPSVNPQIDANALAAARASKYRSATSYCRNVTADYLFKADFSP
jgi:hypothetical protein